MLAQIDLRDVSAVQALEELTRDETPLGFDKMQLRRVEAGVLHRNRGLRGE